MNKKKIYVIVETQVSKNGNIYTWIRRSFTDLVLAQEFLSKCQRNYESSGNYDVAILTENVSFRAVCLFTHTTCLEQLIETEVE